jgi:lipoprotein-anchoring transpeptidase ErfK/SrfK
MYMAMNTTVRFALAPLPLCFLTIALATLWSQPVWADTRQDAVSERSRLHQSPTARNMSDEVKSVDATFAIAEHYFQSNDLKQSERFYLLTIQKARIILASTPKTAEENTSSPTTVPSLPDPYKIPAPEGDLQTTTVPDVEPQASPAAIPEPPAVTQEVTPATTEPQEEYVSEEISSDKLVGTASTYSVVKGDTIRLIAAKLGVSRQHLVIANKLDDKAFLKIGQKLLYNNRKIVPQRMTNGIVVNIPDRTLYYFRGGKPTISIPVALGVAVKTEKYDWKTPTGKFRIIAKMKDPTWHVPPSIQSEMEDHGKEIITSVPPGATNPLGKYAMKTSIPGILIHSTTKPGSIYSFASHGCIRVYPEQMEEFFKEVKVNTPGEIIYKPVKLAVTEQGRVFMEVHRDVYGKSSGLALEARRLIEKQNLSEQVDWKKVESIVRLKSGVAEDITL